jgi:hypothetical protein
VFAVLGVLGITRSISNCRSTSSRIQRPRGVVAVVRGDDLSGSRTLRASDVQVGGEVGVQERVEVEVGLDWRHEEDGHVTSLEFLLRSPALDAGEVSDQCRVTNGREGPQLRPARRSSTQHTRGIRSTLALARVAAPTVEAERNVSSSPVCEAAS